MNEWNEEQEDFTFIHDDDDDDWINIINDQPTCYSWLLMKKAKTNPASENTRICAERTHTNWYYIDSNHFPHWLLQQSQFILSSSIFPPYMQFPVL